MSGELELVRQIGRGDAAAYRLLVEREARYLYGIAHALTGNPADAEDLVQETFAGLLKSRFRGDSSLRTWLVSILVRQAAMMRRSRKRRRESASDVEGDAPVRSPHAASAVTDARLDLSVMLESLSADHRAVIVLRELQGMSYEEIANTLRIPRGTVESRLHRAREELRQRYRDYL